MRGTVAGLLAAVVAASVGLVQLDGQAAPWNLVAHEIGTGLRGGYQVVAADINKDGRVDLLAVATSATADLVWFENPTWTRHVMASGLPSMINADAFDIDKDGIPEVALASGFATAPTRSAGVMTMLTHGADVNAPWTAKEFDRTPTAHRVRWIDALGNGQVLEQKGMAAAGCALAHLNADQRLDLACIGTATANLKWYENLPVK